MNEFKNESDSVQAVPSFPNIFEYINYSNKRSNKEIVEDLIIGINKEVEWYENFGDTITPYDRSSQFTNVLTNRTLARPLFELCFEGDKEDPKDMFLMIKANPLFIRDTVIGVNGRIYFDGRIDYGVKYPFFEDKKINLVKADTRMLCVDFYGLREYDVDYSQNYTIPKERKEDFIKGCQLLGLDDKDFYHFMNTEQNPESLLLKKVRLYKIEKKNIKEDCLNVLFTPFQKLSAIDEFILVQNSTRGKVTPVVSGLYRDCKSFYWDLPFIYLKDLNADFGALNIECMKGENLDIDYHFQESCFGKPEIVKEVNEFQTYSSFLCNQQERLVDFVKYYE